MKKVTFDFQEKVTYGHSIEIEIPDDEEDDFEFFADNVVDEIEEDSQMFDKDYIISKFSQKYGRDKVTFTEDGSPEVEFECM